MHRVGVALGGRIKGLQAILSGSTATGLEPELFGATLGMEYALR